MARVPVSTHQTAFWTAFDGFGRNGSPPAGQMAQIGIFSHISTLPTRPRAGDSYIMGLG